MAQHARLEKACLVVEGRRSRRPAETGLGVALQAQQVYIAQLQHVRIRSAMHQVAGLAAVNLYGLVLEYKRPLLVRMACEADRILRGRGSHLLGPHCAVRIMAVSTLDEPFVHSMMERHVEFGLLRQVARITKLGLRLHQHEIGVFAVVRRMAGNATDLVPRVFGVDSVHVLRAARVAAQAARVNFFRGSFFEEEELGRVGWVSYVARSGAVAILAAVFGDPTFLVRLFPMRAFFPAVVNVLVASLAALRARVVGSIRRGPGFLFLYRECQYVGGSRWKFRRRLCQNGKRPYP